MIQNVFITGWHGQIGSYLCDLFLQNNYIVYGLSREKLDDVNKRYISNIYSNKNFHNIIGNITDNNLIINTLLNIQPDVFINCAAQSNVTISFEKPEYTMNATGQSVQSCLDAIRLRSPHTKFVTLGSSEMFGQTNGPFDESSQMDPQSPYAKAKLFGYDMVKMYRKEFDLFASNAICFNSESPRRSEAYVTQKIVKTAVKIKLGLEKKLKLGNILSMRDWSHASDTANAIYKIAAFDHPDDFIIASGETHSVKEFVEKVFQYLQLNWVDYVIIDPNLFRTGNENKNCFGDSSKLKKQLNWIPKYNFNQLIEEMVSEELKLMGSK